MTSSLKLPTRSPRALRLACGLAASIAACAAAVPHARAQNALGDGRALDANLQVGSGGFNPAKRDFAAEVALRNAIVTGNVGGGKEFRGAVGYVAPEDFRGALGSTETFPFLRDSFYSTTSVQSLRGLTSLQLQFGLSSAGQTSGVGGDLIIQRPGAGASIRDFAGGGGGAGAVPTLDVFGRISGALRSTSATILRDAIEPQVLGTAQLPNGAVELMTASSLQGVRSLPPNSTALGADPLSTPSATYSAPPVIKAPASGANPEEEIAVSGSRAGAERVTPGGAGASRANAWLIDSIREQAARARAESGKLPALMANAPQPSPTTDPTAADPSAPTTVPPGTTPTTPTVPGAVPPADETTTFQDGADGASAEPAIDWRTYLEQSWEQLRTGLTPPAAEEPSSETSPLAPGITQPLPGTAIPQAPLPGDLNEELLARVHEILGGQAMQVETLLPPETSVNQVYVQHMEKGQAALAEERWFDAEERFTAGLLIRPGDPAAAAGRINAQISAGMYLSAAMNLRNLYRAYPEFITVRFDEKLRARGQRLDLIRDQLRARCERDTGIALDAAFLLAFVGYQTENADDMKAGFEAIERIQKSSAGQPDPLYAVLKAAWMP